MFFLMHHYRARDPLLSNFWICDNFSFNCCCLYVRIAFKIHIKDLFNKDSYFAYLRDRCRGSRPSSPARSRDSRFVLGERNCRAVNILRYLSALWSEISLSIASPRASCPLKNYRRIFHRNSWVLKSVYANIERRRAEWIAYQYTRRHRSPRTLFPLSSVRPSCWSCTSSIFVSPCCPSTIGSALWQRYINITMLSQLQLRAI